MIERPILFSGDMVRAILDGRKTQTRRIVKFPKNYAQVDFGGGLGDDRDDPCNWGFEDQYGDWWALKKDESSDREIPCPYGQPGDRLYVKEAWRAAKCGDDFKPRELSERFYRVDMGGLWYEADGAEPKHPVSPRGRYRHARFMPRWASRIMLEITDIRVERLQDISEQDAKAEGINDCPFRPDDGFPICIGHTHLPDDGKCALHVTRAQAFRELWESINGPGSWEQNPWVWVIGFRGTES